MSNLRFEEKVILTLYLKFYGVEYPVPELPIQTSNTDLITDEHIKVQKMCYLLNLSGLYVGNYNYSWNTYGPYSPSLQVDLRILDQKHDLVRSFYALKLSDSDLFSDVDDENSLFWKDDEERIQTIISSLNIPNDTKEAKDWMELLGSIAYISHNFFPHCDFDYINEELIARKQQFKNIEKNKEAWIILDNLQLLSVS